MDAPLNPPDARFQAFLAKLTAQQPLAWGEKQKMELDMARALSTEMLQLAERLRDSPQNLEGCLVLLKYAKVLDFIVSSLAARREINPQTLRTIFRLANLKVDEAYPG